MKSTDKTRDAVHAKAQAVIHLLDSTPDGVIHDPDTILKDVMDESDLEVTGIARDIIDIWMSASDQAAAEAMFEALSGCSFQDWLDRCLEQSTRSQGAPTAQQVRQAEQVLADNGIDPDECSTVLQALGYVLLDRELYPGDSHDEKEDKKEC